MPAPSILHDRSLLDELGAHLDEHDGDPGCGYVVDKADPFGCRHEEPPATASVAG